MGDSVTTLFNGVHGFSPNSRLGLFAGDFCDSAYIDVSDSIILETEAFSTMGLTDCYLSFKHICKVDFFDLCKVEVSSDNGATWIQLGAEYITGWINPPGAPWSAIGFQFSSACYPDWQSGNALSIPNTSWWKYEFFDLNAFVNLTQVKVRFLMKDTYLPGGNGNSGWYIDDIKVGYFQIWLDPYFNFFGSSMYCTLPTTVNFRFGLPALGYTINDTLTVHVYFGDGNDTIINLVPYFFTDSITHSYLLPGTFNPYVVITSNFGYSNTINGNPIIIYNNCVSITGKMYRDNNSDCIYNSGDIPLVLKRVFLLLNGQIFNYTITDFNGDYQFNVVPVGPVYEVAADTLTNSNLNFLCPASGIQSVATIPAPSPVNFAFTCSSLIDLSVEVVSYLFRNILPSYGYMFLRAIGCQSFSTTIKHWIDNKASITSTNPPYSFMAADTFYWSSSAFNPYYSCYYASMMATNNVTFSPGDSVDVYVEVVPVAGEINLSNNTLFRRIPAFLSWDPNDKQVSPSGDISPSQELTYMIRFQNTGNDTAFNIFVLDTLSQYLDVSTLEMIGASHPMSIDVVTSHVLKFNFYNILLPDSGTNEPESHGYILYKIKPLPGLLNGTAIENTAHIFFDWNPPVTTNTTISIIDSALATSINLVPSAVSAFSLYPNPANEEVVVHFPAFTEGECRYIISDAMGKTVQNGRITSARQSVSLSTIANGVYQFQLTGKQVNALVKKLVVVRE